jgi:hypothetical protein
MFAANHYECSRNLPTRRSGIGNNSGERAEMAGECEKSEMRAAAEKWKVERPEFLQAKRPEAVLYGVRVEYPAAYQLGGHFEK